MREIYANDPKRLPTGFGEYRTDIQPFNEGFSHNRALYPSPEAVSRTCGGLQKAWKLLGYDVEVRMKKPRKYEHLFTKEVSKQIEEIYSRPNAKKNSGYQGGLGIKAFAATLGVPHHVVIHQAARLGLGRTKEKPWSMEEFAALNELAHYAPDVIARKFRERGLHRTRTSIAVMRKRRWAHKGAPYYSAHALTTLMGVDGHTLDRVWIAKGIRFIAKGTTRGKKNKKQGGDTKLVHIDEVRRFFIEHPEEIDLQKVDKLWFLEMITAGKIKMIQPSARLRMRSEAPRPGMIQRKANQLTIHPS